MKAPVAVLCLNDAARDDFLPPDLRSELEELLPGLIGVPVAGAWNVDPDFFERVRPEIIVSGWGAPRLPDSRERMPSLEYVCHLAGSVRGVVPRSLIEQGLMATNWGTCHADTVAECALMLVLSTLRRATATNLAMHVDKGWRWPTEQRPSSLFGRRVGLHGFGAVARSLLPLLRPFGVGVTAFSSGVPADVFAKAGVRRADSLEELFSSSDVIVEIEAATPQNIATVTEAQLRSIPDGGVFVNVGRAAVVEESALLRVAAEGRLQIGLDVYHHEPLPADSPLRGLPNVCLLSHQAGPTPDRLRDAGRIALDNIRAYLAGEPLLTPVTLEAFDRAT